MSSLVAARRSAGPGALPDGPRYATPFGFLRELRADTLGYVQRNRERYGDAVCIRMGPMRSLMLFHPDHVRHVLVRNHRNYGKGRLFGKLRRIAGNGILFAEGEDWLRKRRLTTPAFQRARIEALVPHMTRASSEMLSRWEREYANGAPFDLVPEMSKLALDIVCRGMFGTDVVDRADHFRRSVDVAIGYANYLLNHFVVPPLAVPTRRHRAVKAALATATTLFDEMIGTHRSTHPPPGDLLGLLLQARDEETGAALSDAELRDELMTFVNAGHETTAMTLSWALWAIAMHPAWEERLHEEVDRVLGGRPPSLADIPALEQMDRVIRETLRLYPPAWAIPRQALRGDEAAGVRIPAGVNVTLSPYVTHRHPEFWSEPERFDPDRFAPERAEPAHRFAYFPFGAGGRRCIGEDFARLELGVVLASVVQRHRLRVEPEPAVVPDPVLTLRPRDGIRVRLAPRF